MVVLGWDLKKCCMPCHEQKSFTRCRLPDGEEVFVCCNVTTHFMCNKVLEFLPEDDDLYV